MRGLRVSQAGVGPKGVAALRRDDVFCPEAIPRPQADAIDGVIAQDVLAFREEPGTWRGAERELSLDGLRLLGLREKQQLIGRVALSLRDLRVRADLGRGGGRED
jgi:hypothetical protein